jgi:nuclear pore complex protein Nup155
MQTPQRPLPGAFFNTPAASRFGAPPQPSIFRPTGLAVAPPGATPQDANPQQTTSQSLTGLQNRSIQPIQRAARTINETLQKEANFPDLDSYVRRKYKSST